MKGPQFSYIYGLKDPRDGGVYYVGKSNDPATRYQQHMEKKTNRQKIAWIESLEREGLQPELVILETVARSEWRESERHWIALGREEGWPLTNIKDGGDGSDEFVGPSYEFMRSYVHPDLWATFDALGIREKDVLCVRTAQAMIRQPITDRTAQMTAGRAEIDDLLG